MSDDIVTRLREETCPMPECCWLFADAADEIEALDKFADEMTELLNTCRIERNRWRKMYENARALAVTYLWEQDSTNDYDECADRVDQHIDQLMRHG